ncbi:MAG TPA: A24 family peptidase [Polyangiales bacterium]|nr:A24 family peptidase [Polyangiales bacterium]
MTPFELAAVVVTGVAAVCDLRTGHIPNWLTLGSLLGAVVAHATLGALAGGVSELLYKGGEALVGVGICAAVPMLIFLRGGMGGGDVKLFAALGALCSARAGLLAELYSFVMALAWVPVHLVHEGRLFRSLGNALVLLPAVFRRRSSRPPLTPELTTWVRLAPAIFLGTLTMLLLGR